jgi:hypothetical protein
MTTPPPPPPSEPRERPATLAEQAAAALDISDDILTVLEQLVARIDALEHTQQARGGAETRSDFRFDAYPAADTESDQHHQLDRAVRAWQRLHGWVDWLVATYKLTAVIPPCWPAHPTIREELIGLRVAWTGAWSDTATHEAVVIFHEKLATARTRLLDGNWGHPRCPGRHDDTGLDLAELYRAWADTPGRDTALIAARDHALALVRGGWQNTAGGER